MKHNNSLPMRLQPVVAQARRPSLVLAGLVVALVVGVAGYVVVRPSRAAGVVGDLNNDGTVNVFDLSIMLSDWGTANPTADLNHDGTVSVFDLSALLTNWGKAASSTATLSPSPSGSPIGFNTCTNPAETVPMDPNDAQSGIGIGNFYLTNDSWNAGGYSVAQTMYICDYNNWYAIANMDNNNGDGAVKTYPNVHQDFINWNMNAMPAISSYHTINSTFAETGPHVGIYEWAYDIWLNGVADNNSTEVMIWNDNFGQTPGGSKVGSFSDGGQTYDVYRDESGGGQYIAFVDRTNVTSGTVNLLDFFNYLMTTKAWIPTNSTIGQIDYGAELVSTNSTNAKFQLNNFSLTAQ